MHQLNVLVDGTKSSHPLNLINSNINILNDIRKFNEEYLSFSTKLVIMEGSLNKAGFILTAELVRDLYGLELIFVTKRPELITLVSGLGQVLEADPSQLSYELLCSFINKDLATMEFLINTSLDESLEFSSVEAELEYFRIVNAHLTESLSEKDEILKSLRERATLESESRKIIEGKYKSLLEKAVHNDITLSQLEVAFTRDIYEVVDIDKYPNSPRILYIKEYQDLPHKYSLIRTLADSIRLVLRKPVKVLALMDSMGSRQIHYAPSYYERLFNQYTRVDLLTNEFVLKIGDHTGALDLILSNSVGLDTLIIFDMNSHAESIVNKSNLHLVLARDHAKTVNMGIYPDVIVTNNPEDKLNWLHYPEYESLSEEEKFVFLSSRPLIQKILKSWGMGNGIN